APTAAAIESAPHASPEGRAGPGLVLPGSLDVTGGNGEAVEIRTGRDLVPDGSVAGRVGLGSAGLDRRPNPEPERAGQLPDLRRAALLHRRLGGGGMVPAHRHARNPHRALGRDPLDPRAEPQPEWGLQRAVR